MFRFRLDTILRYRSQVEDHEKRELGKVRSELVVEQQKKRQFEEGARQSGVLLDQKKEIGLLNRDDFLLHYNFVEGMAHNVMRQENRIKKVEERVENQRLKVVDSMRKRQVLSTLKSRRQEEYLFEENREEQKFVDEIVATRWEKEPK